MPFEADRIRHEPATAPAAQGRSRREAGASPTGLLGIQRLVGNQATVGALRSGFIQRIGEDHAWLKTMPQGNARRILGENKDHADLLTKIGDFAISKKFAAHDSKSKRMAFFKSGSLDEAIGDVDASFGWKVDRSSAKSAKNSHSQKPSPLWANSSPKMTLRSFSASSKDTVAAIDFMVGDLIFEFKYTDAAEARRLGHYGEAGPGKEAEPDKEKAPTEPTSTPSDRSATTTTGVENGSPSEVGK